MLLISARCFSLQDEQQAISVMRSRPYDAWIDLLKQVKPVPRLVVFTFLSAS